MRFRLELGLGLGLVIKNRNLVQITKTQAKLFLTPKLKGEPKIKN